MGLTAHGAGRRVGTSAASPPFEAATAGGSGCVGAGGRGVGVSLGVGVHAAGGSVVAEAAAPSIAAGGAGDDGR